MSRPNAWYGWQPDTPDQRDLRFKVERAPGVLPASVDLTAQFPACYDQGELGSCTANAIAGVLEFDQCKQAEKGACTPSRLFIYYNERVIEGTVREDAGAEIRDGIKSVATIGAPPEKAWPYKVSKFANKPTKRAFSQAKAHEALLYERLDNTRLNDLCACLAAGFPFVFGFTCYEAFESDEVEKTGVLNLPEPDEKVVGGHAVVCVGYDDASARWRVRNSWGNDWGQNGYFTMPYAYLTDPNLADDFWRISQVK